MLTKLEIERRAESLVDKEIMNIKSLNGVKDEKLNVRLDHIETHKPIIVQELTALMLDVQHFSVNQLK